MITQLKIENYKSIQDLTLDVGRVNVLIGENGCGKSNILEAITLAAAAEADKLDKEFLKNRGIRVTEPQLMRASFDNSYQDKAIKIIFKSSLNSEEESYTLENDNHTYSKWVRLEDNKYYLDYALNAILKNNSIRKAKYQIFPIENNKNEVSSETKDRNEKARIEFRKRLKSQNLIVDDLLSFESEYKLKTLKSNLSLFIENFIIFSPENTTLRDFSKEANIEPLGDKGEGLLTLLIHTQHEAKQSNDFNELNDIQETLELFGWYEAIEIPNDFSLLEKKITIKDRYLEMPFDQRSANEGFLLVLFYITLVVSKYTPKIFAIDNIDTSLNPKLCTKLITELSRLAKKYDKQIFLTSHNPAILDGIDLGDDEQRLFVVSRNREGHTCCDRIELKDKPKSSIRARLSRIFDENKTYTKAQILEQFDNSDEPLKLSYALLRGYLGGLPENFDL